MKRFQVTLQRETAKRAGGKLFQNLIAIFFSHSHGYYFLFVHFFLVQQNTVNDILWRSSKVYKPAFTKSAVSV
jgi:hypothetical protein